MYLHFTPLIMLVNLIPLTSKLGSDEWFSTNAGAYCALNMSRYAGTCRFWALFIVNAALWEQLGCGTHPPWACRCLSSSCGTWLSLADGRLDSCDNLAATRSWRRLCQLFENASDLVSAVLRRMILTTSEEGILKRRTSIDVWCK